MWLLNSSWFPVCWIWHTLYKCSPSENSIRLYSTTTFSLENGRTCQSIRHVSNHTHYLVVRKLGEHKAKIYWSIEIACEYQNQGLISIGTYILNFPSYYHHCETHNFSACMAVHVCTFFIRQKKYDQKYCRETTLKLEPQSLRKCSHMREFHSRLITAKTKLTKTETRRCALRLRRRLLKIRAAQ